MKSSLIQGLGIALLLALPSGLVAEDQEQGQDLKAADLAGVYTIVSSINDGKPSPKEKIDGVIVRFTDSAVVVTDRDENEVYTARYKLGATKQPTVITMTSMMEGQEVSTQGLIKQEKDQVTLIYALPGAPKAPSDFKPGKGLMLLVLAETGAGLQKQEKPGDKVEREETVRPKTQP